MLREAVYLIAFTLSGWAALAEDSAKYSLTDGEQV
jgi:hypothetical protein